MPPPADSVAALLDQLKAGDAAAARPIWDRFYRPLVAVARRRLGTAPTGARDEEDVALSAFASFCDGVKCGRFPQLDDRGDLWAVLFRITVSKAAQHARHEGRLKRGAGRVLQASDLDLGEVADQGPPPDVVAELSDSLQDLLGRLPDADLRRIAAWKLEGYFNHEIARLLGKSEPTVERKLARIRAIWERAGVA